MSQYRISETATLLGVSDDTVRRLVDTGVLPAHHDAAGRKVIPGEALAAYLVEHAPAAVEIAGVASSARNRFTGLVTKVTSDTVMSEVQLQCGPFTVVSLMSTESVHRLGLEPGRLATAIVKATTVVVDVPA